jgi:hypothetical protein
MPCVCVCVCASTRICTYAGQVIVGARASRRETQEAIEEEAVRLTKVAHTPRLGGVDAPYFYRSRVNSARRSTRKKRRETAQSARHCKARIEIPYHKKCSSSLFMGDGSFPCEIILSRASST